MVPVYDGWWVTRYHTAQWAYAVLIALGIFNLYLSIKKAGGKLMWTTIFFLVGMTLTVFPYWFTMYHARAYVWFFQTGNFGIVFAIIMMA